MERMPAWSSGVNSPLPNLSGTPSAHHGAMVVMVTVAVFEHLLHVRHCVRQCADAPPCKGEETELRC